MFQRSCPPRDVAEVNFYLHATFSESVKDCVYLFFRQLGDVVHSSVRLDLGVKMVDDGP